MSDKVNMRVGSFLSGPAGTARELLYDLKPTDPNDWLAHIGHWFIDAPGQSVAWRHYLLSAVHLRPIADVKPAVLKFPEATHEFMLWALDPNKKPVPDDPDSWSLLSPSNLVEQVQLRDDEVAATLLNYAARDVVDGRLWAEPPLSGQVEPWRSWLRQHGAELS